MARHLATLTCALVALCFVAAHAADEPAKKTEDKPKAEAKFTAKCPVSGQPAKKEAATAYKDKEVYFCCDKCKAAFEADNTKFTVKANHQLFQTKQYRQAKCPMSGGDLNKEQKTKIAGVNVQFCCENCKGKAEKATGDDQLALIFSDAAFKKGFVAKKEKKEDPAAADKKG